MSLNINGQSMHAQTHAEVRMCGIDTTHNLKAKMRESSGQNSISWNRPAHCLTEIFLEIRTYTSCTYIYDSTFSNQCQCKTNCTTYVHSSE